MKKLYLHKKTDSQNLRYNKLVQYLNNKCVSGCQMFGYQMAIQISEAKYPKIGHWDVLVTVGRTIQIIASFALSFQGSDQTLAKNSTWYCYSSKTGRFVNYSCML